MNERKKIEAREYITNSEKVKIANKSNNRCAHCGKPIAVGVNFSLEHIIPISKGGTNSFVNLLGLCKECNVAKGDLIVQPMQYYKYLNYKYLEPVNKMFSEYIKNVDYLDSNNLFSVDLFEFNLGMDKNLERGFMEDFNTLSDMLWYKSVARGITVKKVLYSDLNDIYLLWLSCIRNSKKWMDSDRKLKDYVKSNLDYMFKNNSIYGVYSKEGLVGAFCLGVITLKEGVRGLLFKDVYSRYKNYTLSIVSAMYELAYELKEKLGFSKEPIFVSCGHSKNAQKCIRLMCVERLGGRVYELENGRTVGVVFQEPNSSTEDVDVLLSEFIRNRNTEYQKWLYSVFSCLFSDEYEEYVNEEMPYVE